MLEPIFHSRVQRVPEHTFQKSDLSYISWKCHSCASNIHLAHESCIWESNGSERSPSSVWKRSSRVSIFRKPVARRGRIHQKKLWLKTPLVISGEYALYGGLRYVRLLLASSKSRAALITMLVVNKPRMEGWSFLRYKVRTWTASKTRLPSK